MASDTAVDWAAHETADDSGVRRFGNYIGGKTVPAADGQTTENIDPATGENLGRFAQSAAADVEQAVAAAEDALPAWSALAPMARASIVGRAADLIVERLDPIARDLTREEGKTLGEARGEVLNAVAKLRFAVSEASHMNGETLASAEPGLHLYTVREPIGVVAVVSPWNFPFSTPASKVGIGLVAGNTMVMKPASLTPLSSVHLMRAFADAGVPPGVLNLVMGGGGSVGSPLVSHPRVRGVSFTGSTEVGIGIAREAAGHLAKTQLELGGKNPLVVMDDADIELAARAAVDGAFMSCGQKCTATSRIIVHENIKRGLLDRILERTRAINVGNGLDPASYMGPLVDAGQLESVGNWIDVGRKEGARLLLGGERLTDGDHAGGFYMRPAVFDEVAPEMRIAREEIFGPVLSVLAVSSFEEALEIANASDYGLSSAIFTGSLRHAQEFARRMQAGVVKINGQTPGNAPNAPFGGRKSSGMNISLRPIDFFTELKSVYQRIG